MRENFLAYTQEVTKWVGGNKNKMAVREELYDHLVENYERNLAMGMEEEAAEADALQKMGNPEILRMQFSEIYSIFPGYYMRVAINLLGWGICCNLFRIDMFFAGFSLLFQLFGILFLGFALLYLQGINKLLRVSFWVHMTYAVSHISLMFLSAYYLPQEPAYRVVTVLTYLSLALQFVVWLTLFPGLHRAIEPLRQPEEKSPHFIVLTVLFVCYFACIAFFVTSQDEIVTVEFPFSLLLAIPFIALFVSLRRAKKICLHEEPEPEIEKPIYKKQKRIYAFAAVGLLMLPFFLMPVAAYRQPQAEVYQPQDTAQTETAASVRAHMISIGCPEAVVQDLPDSEVLQYQTAKFCLPASGMTNRQIDKVIENAYCFLFPVEGEPENYTMRILICLTQLEKETDLRSGFYMYFEPDQVRPSPIYLNGEHKEDFFTIALAEKNGKTECAAPLHRTVMEGEYRTFGAEFAFPKDSVNRRAYLAVSAVWRSPQEKFIYCNASTVFQKYPLFLENKNTLTLGQSSMQFGSIFGLKDPFFRSFDSDISFNFFQYEEENQTL